MKTIQTRKRYTDEIIAYLSLKGEDLGKKKNSRYKTVAIYVAGAEDHPPPHIHVKLGKGTRDPAFDIKEGKLFKNQICPQDIQNAVIVWLSNAANRARAIQEWNRCQRKYPYRDQESVLARKLAISLEMIDVAQELERLAKRLKLLAQRYL